MRRGRLLIFLLLFVIVLGALAFVFLTQLGGAPGTAPTQAALTEIYYASQNIPQGTVITQEMVSTFSIPSNNVAEVMFTKGEESNLIGQTARFTLEQGVVISSSMVGGGTVEISGPAWAVQIPASMVAVSIPTTRLATVAYGVTDGAHVNVNACLTFIDVDPGFQSVLPNYTSVVEGTGFLPDTLPILSAYPFTEDDPTRQGRVELDPTLQQPFYVVPSEKQRPRLVCQMILQDVVVMKLGNFNAPVPATDPNATPSPAQVQQGNPDIVTLMVSPQDSISLNYFMYSGAQLILTLRNPNDTSRFEAQSATLTSLLTQYNISLPSKLPYALQPRTDLLLPPSLPNDVINTQPQQ